MRRGIGKLLPGMLLGLMLSALTACGETNREAAPGEPAAEEIPEETASAAEEIPEETASAAEEIPEDTQMKELRLMIGDREIAVDWEENESVTALAELAQEPLTVRMSMYGEFEQVGSLGESLPRNDTQMSTSPGDIVLYSGNQVVIFYGTNSWAYTKLGRVREPDRSDLADLLGSGDVTLTFSCGAGDGEE